MSKIKSDDLLDIDSIYKGLLRKVLKDNNRNPVAMHNVKQEIFVALRKRRFI